MDVARPLLGSIIFLLSASTLVSCAAQSSSAPEAKLEKTTFSCEGTAIQNRFIVHWNDGSTSIESAADRDALVRDVITPNNDKINWAEHDYRVAIPKAPEKEAATVTAMAAAEADPASWGQADIHAPEAWQLATGKGIIVAVVDSGSEITHAQLKNQIAVNTAELKGKAGVDDDGNGYIDDIYGYDFVKKSGDIHDGDTGHGTHVSGVIAAEHISDNAPKGIAPDARLLPLNFMDNNGSGDISNAVSAIDYAVARGAKIINASWGGEFCSLTLRNKISELEARGVMFVAAAGNGDSRTGIGYDIEERASFPAAYDFPSVVTVGAINSVDRMTGFSNYGRKLVALVAPGEAIRSTYPMKNSHAVHCERKDDAAGYCTMSGTSMATPFVAGAAAVVWSYRPNATLAQVRAALLSSVVSGDYAVASHGKLDLRNALDAIDRLTR